MANHRAEEVSLERKIIRNGKSRGHTVILLRPSALGEWLSHNTYIVDPGHAQRVDDGGKDPKRDRFVATQENALLCVLQLRVNLCAELMNVDRIVAKVDVLAVVDAGLQDGRCDHEDDEQNQDHIHKRDHIDFGERRLRGLGKLHDLVAQLQRPGWRPRKIQSKAFSTCAVTSMAKLSRRCARSRMFCKN